MTYTVKDEAKKEVFKGESQLQCEFVAISLALASLYQENKQTYTIHKSGKVLGEVDHGQAFTLMQSKMRNLIYNRKVTERMPLGLERLTGYIHKKYASQTQEAADRQVLKKIHEIKDELEEYNKFKLKG